MPAAAIWLRAVSAAAQVQAGIITRSGRRPVTFSAAKVPSSVLPTWGSVASAGINAR